MVPRSAGISVLVIALLACGQGSGVVGTVLIAGGPPGYSAGAQPVVLIISASGAVVVQRSVTSGTTAQVALPPGRYHISGAYGDLPCSGPTVEVTAGAFAPFTVLCEIR
jgi:hypothetical protein